MILRLFSLGFVVYSVVLLAQARILSTVYGALPVIEDEQYKTACGPIACSVALRSLGVDASLDEVANKCRWEKDRFVPLDTLNRALQSYRGIDCQLAKLSPQELCELLRDDQTVVILATRKNSQAVDHSVCAVAVEDNGQTIRLIDYPELMQQKTLGEIADAWDGVALLVRVSPLYRAIDKFFGLFFTPMVGCIVVVSWLYGRRQRKKNTSAPQSDG